MITISVVTARPWRARRTSIFTIFDGIQVILVIVVAVMMRAIFFIMIVVVIMVMVVIEIVEAFAVLMGMDLAIVQATSIFTVLTVAR